MSRIASLAAAVAGALVGYDFGVELDGVLLGVVAGANMAVLAALLTDAAIKWIGRRLPGANREA